MHCNPFDRKICGIRVSNLQLVANKLFPLYCILLFLFIARGSNISQCDEVASTSSAVVALIYLAARRVSCNAFLEATADDQS
jgi:hypothetical protein